MSKKELGMLYNGYLYTKPTIKIDEGCSVLVYCAFT